MKIPQSISKSLRPALISLIIGVVVIMSLKFQAHPAFAQIKFTPEVPFPGFSGTRTVSGNFLGEYIRAIYVYFIWVVGLLATFMVIFGGVKWIAAAGNPAQIREARATINNAIVGIIIALTSVVLLNTINPKLTIISLTQPSTVQPHTLVGLSIKHICPASEKVNCGQVKLTGTTSTGEETYCMGTVCSLGGFGGFGESHHICNLLANTATRNYEPGAGCLSNVPIESLPGDYAGTATLRVEAPPPVYLHCTHVFSDSKLAGSACSTVPANDSYFSDKDICFMVGPKLQIDDQAGTDDRTKNAYCTIT